MTWAPARPRLKLLYMVSRSYFVVFKSSVLLKYMSDFDDSASMLLIEGASDNGFFKTETDAPAAIYLL